MDSSASLTGGHVVHHPDMESGSSLIMEEWFQIVFLLQHFTETEVMMEQLT